MVSKGLDAFEGVIKSLLQASMANPLMAAIAGLIINNILYRAGIIDQNTTRGIALIIFVGCGIDATAQILDDITNISNIVGNRPSGQSIINPTPTTLVLSNEKSQELTAALLKLLQK